MASPRVANVVAKYKASALRKLAGRIYERAGKNPVIGVILAREILKEAGLLKGDVEKVFGLVQHLGVDGIGDLKDMVKLSLDNEPENLGPFCVEMLKTSDHRDAASQLSDALSL